MPSYTVKAGALDLSTAYSFQRKLARTSDGTLWCVYHRSDGTYNQIYASYSTDGGETWTEEQVTNATDHQYYPSVAIDSQNTIHVVWHGLGWGTNSTYGNIQYRKRTSSGWQPIEAVTDKNADQYVPSIAIDSNDNIHVVWRGLGWGTNTDYWNIQYRKRTSSGWQPIEAVTDKNADQYDSSIAIDSNDNIHVVWRGLGWGTNTDYWNIQYRKRTSSGWQSQEAVTDIVGRQRYISFAIDDSDNIHVVWPGKGWGTNTDYWNIQYRKRTSSGWQPIEAVTDKNADQTDSVIVIDKGDNIHVVWRGLGWGTSTGYYNIQYRKRTSSGWEAQEGLTDTANNHYFPNSIWAFHPTIFEQKTNRPRTGYAFVWVDGTTIKFYRSSDFTASTILHKKTKWQVVNLSNWQYRKKLTIAGSSGAGTNYQVLLKVGESSGASGCDFHVEGHSANFPSDTNNSGDLRFTDNDGTTLLSFWVEKVEGTSPNRTAYVWVKVADNLDSSQDVYCYYGNASASNVSSVSDTFIREIDGVVGSWHFDEGSGTTVKDTSGNNHNGTINSATWVDGKFGEALNFDGSNDYVDLGDILDDVFAGADKKFSFSLWVKPASEMTNNFMIAKCADTACSEDQRQFLFRLYNNKPAFLYYCARDASTYRGVLGSTPITDLNKWYHLVMTYDGSVDTNDGLDRVKIHVDGATESTSLHLSRGTLGAIQNGTAHLGIGKHLSSSGTNCGSSFYFNGIIDEVRIYNKVLTADEISDLYNNYGYTTISYPGKVLVRKRTDPEPSFSSVGNEEITQLTSNLTTAWKLLSTYNLYSNWKLLNGKELSAQWKIFEKLTKDTAWQIIATETISRIIEWKLLATSEVNSQWKILDGSDLSSSWKLLTRSDEATAWKILGEFGKGMAWKLLLSKSKNISWQILVSNIVSKLIAWKLITYFDIDATWKILGAAKRDTSWKLLTSKVKTTVWKLLTSLDTTSVWKLLSEFSRQSSWKLLTTKDKSLSWQILLLHVLSRDLTWKLITADDISFKWRILTSTELGTSWKLLDWLNKDTSWRILGELTTPLVWKILNEGGRKLSWKVLSRKDKELLWVILSKVCERDIAWKILTSREIDVAWLVGLLAEPLRELVLDSPITGEELPTCRMLSVFMGDVIDVILNVGCDASTATVWKIKYRKPDGQVGAWGAVVDDDPTRIRRKSVIFDKVGWWEIQACIESPPLASHGKIAHLYVRARL